jgi:Anticodon binding domain
VRIVVGKKTLDDGAVDVRQRATGEEARVGSLDAPKWVLAR